MIALKEEAAIDDLVVEIFRSNGALVAEGDRLTREFGLSTARWQVLGAFRDVPRPLTVSQIARNMGLARQSVQRIADGLHADGFVEFSENPDHRRARLVAPTEKGRKAFERVMRSWHARARHLIATSGLTDRRIREAESALRKLRRAFEEDAQ